MNTTQKVQEGDMVRVKPRHTVADVKRANAITHAALPLAPDQKRVFVNIEAVGRVLEKYFFNKPPRNANDEPLSRDFRVVRHFNSGSIKELENQEAAFDLSTVGMPPDQQSDFPPAKRLPTVEEVERSNKRFHPEIANPLRVATSRKIETADGMPTVYWHHRPLDKYNLALLHNYRQMVTHIDRTGPQPQDKGTDPKLVEVIAPELESQYRTGQEWLQAGAKLLHKHVFSKAGYSMPKIVTTIGFPSHQAVSQVRRSGGQCWASSVSENGVNFICISPLIRTDVERLDILAHEMAHAVDDCKSGHRGNFVKICNDIGLTKGALSSASAGAALMHVIEQISRELGPCPFTALNYTPRVRKAAKPTHKLECPQYKFACRTSEGDVEVGLPTCACGAKLVDLSADFPMLA